MLTTVLDLVGLFGVIAAILLVAAILFGSVGLACALVLVAGASLGASWLLDRLRR